MSITYAILFCTKVLSTFLREKCCWSLLFLEMVFGNVTIWFLGKNISQTDKVTSVFTSRKGLYKSLKVNNLYTFSFSLGPVSDLVKILFNRKIRTTFFKDYFVWILVPNSLQDMHSVFGARLTSPQTSPVFSVLLLEPLMYVRSYAKKKCQNSNCHSRLVSISQKSWNPDN